MSRPNKESIVVGNKDDGCRDNLSVGYKTKVDKLVISIAWWIGLICATSLSLSPSLEDEELADPLALESDLASVILDDSIPNEELEELPTMVTSWKHQELEC